MKGKRTSDGERKGEGQEKGRRDCIWKGRRDREKGGRGEGGCERGRKETMEEERKGEE